jgi:hypothetical protein
MIPDSYTLAEAVELFGVTKRLFEREFAPRLRELPPERRRGRPCKCYVASAVHALYREVFDVLPTPDQIGEALRRVQLTRINAALGYTKRRIAAITTLGKWNLAIRQCANEMKELEHG